MFRRTGVAGPLALYAEGFREELTAQGYAVGSAAQQMQLMAHLSRWLATRRLGPEDLTDERAARFCAARRQAGYTGYFSPRALRPLLGYLRSLGAAPVQEHRARTPVDLLVEGYRTYLLRERGLAPGTVVHYVRTAQLFLSSRRVRAAGVGGLDAAIVRDFVLSQCAGRSTTGAKALVCDLRALLRFLHGRGLAADLTAAVPGVAGWRLASLPRAVAPRELKRLLASCDRRRATGRRDYAILVLLARLGLRRGEVAALSLDDLDWRNGELVVHRKGGRDERLPLPADVGDAIAAYVRRGRPVTGRRELFICAHAPRTGLSPAGVSEVVVVASERAGLGRIGAHRLRHTAASAMLRHGAPLAEVAEVLGHRDSSTTAIYAKVDVASLRLVAAPWPGCGR